MFPTKILLATNGSTEAAEAEEAAVELANGTGSELHVVCVVNTKPELPYPRTSSRKRSEALLELRRIGSLEILDRRVRQLEDLGGDVAASHYKEGDPEREILKLAGELEAGLIMTGGRKRSWLERAFGTGFSEHLSRRSSRPVLVVSEQGSRDNVKK